MSFYAKLNIIAYFVMFHLSEIPSFLDFLKKGCITLTTHMKVFLIPIKNDNNNINGKSTVLTH